VTITIADVLRRIDDQLAWRGPNGHGQGHVVLERAQAEYLREWVVVLVKERDELLAEKEARDAV
jgi:hypothetical protein